MPKTKKQSKEQRNKQVRLIKKLNKGQKICEQVVSTSGNVLNLNTTSSGRTGKFSNNYFFE